MTSSWKKITVPCNEGQLMDLRAGDMLLISGTLYSARDKAHERIKGLIEAGAKLPVELRGQFLFYVGPSPARPGRIIGSAGPTTSYRMDPFTEVMLEIGVRGMIGKGKRGPETREILRRFGAVYLSAFGGAGAYYGTRIIAAEAVAFHDLGPEAIYRLTVKDFPAVVVNDSAGGDFYENAFQQRS